MARQVPRARLEDCEEFYGKLGFKRLTEPTGIAGRAIWLGLGATQIHLMPSDDTASEHPGHVAVVINSYEETLARLRDSGHDVQSRREHWGSPRSYVHDPAGNLVELMAWPPADEEPTIDAQDQRSAAPQGEA